VAVVLVVLVLEDLAVLVLLVKVMQVELQCHMECRIALVVVVELVQWEAMQHLEE
jgi:hypothetical protein